MNPLWILYGMFCFITAYLYTKYYIKSHKGQYEFFADDRKEYRKLQIQMTLTIFIISFLFAPVVLANKIYDLVQF